VKEREEGKEEDREAGWKGRKIAIRKEKIWKSNEEEREK
jgi:hypothetical protein